MTSEPESTPGNGAVVSQRDRAHEVHTVEQPAGPALSSVPASPPEEEPPLLETERIPPREGKAALRPGVARVAWTVALAADVVQWVLWPLFIGGVPSPFETAVDVVVAGVLIRLLGWHWVFLPSFIAELIPGVDLVPTWTAAVFLATRGRPKS